MSQQVKNPPAMWKTWVLSLGWEDPLYSGLKNAMDYRPWGHKESDTTERLFTFTSLYQGIGLNNTEKSDPPNKL